MKDPRRDVVTEGRERRLKDLVWDVDSEGLGETSVKDPRRDVVTEGQERRLKDLV